MTDPTIPLKNIVADLRITPKDYEHGLAFLYLPKDIENDSYKAWKKFKTFSVLVLPSDKDTSDILLVISGKE